MQLFPTLRGVGEEDRRDPALQVALGETSTWHVGQLGARCSGQLQIYWILAKFAKFTPEFMPLCALWLAQGGEQVHQGGEVHQGRRRLGLHIYRSAAVQTVGFGEVLHLFAVYTYDQPRRSVGDGLEGDRGLFACKGDVSLQGEQLLRIASFLNVGVD